MIESTIFRFGIWGILIGLFLLIGLIFCGFNVGLLLADLTYELRRKN